MLDIYFENEYGKICEDIENGKYEVFEFRNNFGYIRHMFIKRKISKRINGHTYYDLITPYGYGGPIIINCENEEYKDKLVESFSIAFSKYCKSNFIVSEFIRFHPIINNYKLFTKIYDVEFIRKTLGTNLGEYEDPFTSEFSKSCRKIIKKSLDSGVTYKITCSPDDFSQFKEIYYSTMDRNNANDFYYFNDYYFDNCLKYLKKYIIINEAIYDNKTIAMGFYFKYNDIIHMHLSGTLKEYLHLSPAYVLRYGITIWGKENGYNLIHHGGGKSNNDDDSLFQFKKKFAKNTEFDFYIGKKIWDVDIYNKLCEDRKSTLIDNFFPAYRN